MVGKTKIDRIRSQQIRESCGIQHINEWVEWRRRRREWDEHVKNGCWEISWNLIDNIPAGRSLGGA